MEISPASSDSNQAPINKNDIQKIVNTSHVFMQDIEEFLSSLHDPNSQQKAATSTLKSQAAHFSSFLQRQQFPDQHVESKAKTIISDIRFYVINETNQDKMEGAAEGLLSRLQELVDSLS